MRPHSQNTSETVDLFLSQLDQIINMDHELIQLSQAVDWEYLNKKNSNFYSEEGRPDVTSRLMISLHILEIHVQFI